MRCVRVLLCLLAAMALGAGSAQATTVVLSGTWDDFVSDTLGVTNGAIVAGGSWSATFVFDETTTDTDSTSNIGAYLFSASSTDLVLSTGGFTFSLPSTAAISLGIEDNEGGQDAFGFLTDLGNYTASGPFVAGTTTGSGYANLSMFDSSQTAHTSDDLTDLPWDATAYDNTNFYFTIQTFNGGDDGSIELSGSVTALEVLPEPSTVSLIALACAALAVSHRRG